MIVVLKGLWKFEPHLHPWFKRFFGIRDFNWEVRICCKVPLHLCVSFFLLHSVPFFKKFASLRTLCPLKKTSHEFSLDLLAQILCQQHESFSFSCHCINLNCASIQFLNRNEIFIGFMHFQNWNFWWYWQLFNSSVLWLNCLIPWWIKMREEEKNSVF